jgi:hypothetical protein
MRVVSGGQTGVDRAALDVAIELEIAYAGWCPRGGWAEDLTEPPGLLTAYPNLTETPTADGRHRTVRNVRDSDATLVLTPAGVTSPGTTLAVLTAQRLGRPVLVASPRAALDVLGWLESLDEIGTLNVAGPRESEAPGVYAAAAVLLRAVLPR